MLNDIYTETRNANLSAVTSKSVNKAKLVEIIQRFSMRLAILHDVLRREREGLEDLLTDPELLELSERIKARIPSQH